MKKIIKQYIDSFLGKFQFILLKKDEYLKLLDKSKFAIMPNLLEKLINSSDLNSILKHITNSKAQLFQDIICLELNQFKTNGFFVTNTKKLTISSKIIFKIAKLFFIRLVGEF
jgi:hypothetical protein